MNHYEREIFDNTRVELIKVEISHSRVYAIVNYKRNKRVLVVFGGSQLTSDIYRDAKLIFVSGYKDLLSLDSGLC